MLLLRLTLLVSDTEATTPDIASAEAAALVVDFAEVTLHFVVVAIPPWAAAPAVAASVDVAATSRPVRHPAGPAGQDRLQPFASFSQPPRPITSDSFSDLLFLTVSVIPTAIVTQVSPKDTP